MLRNILDNEWFLIGPPRTGTTSLWKSLNHPEIAISREKEILNKTSKVRNIEDYIGFFELENQKYLFEGTPRCYCNRYELTKKLADSFKGVRILYVLRNPYDRLFSFYKMMINVHPKLILNSSLFDIYYRKCWIKDNFIDSLHIEYTKKITDKILFTRMDQFKFEDLFDFLEIERIPHTLKHLNRQNMPIEWKTYLEMVVFGHDRHILQEIFNEDIDKLEKITSIDLSDWRE